MNQEPYKRPRVVFRKLSSTDVLAYPFAFQKTARIYTGISVKGRLPARPFTIILDEAVVWLSVANEPILMRLFGSTFGASTAAASLARNVNRASSIMAYEDGKTYSTAELAQSLVNEIGPLLDGPVQTVAKWWLERAERCDDEPEG